jgi:lactate 2-monooxygenase
MSYLLLTLLSVARPFMYALTVGGQDGVEEVLRMILADLEITLGLSGYSSLQDIQGKRDQVLVKID